MAIHRENRIFNMNRGERPLDYCENELENNLYCREVRF